MRSFLTWCGKQFPPAHVTERFLPLVLVVFAITGGIWVLFEFHAGNKASRSGRILELYRQYTEPGFQGRSLRDIQRDLADKMKLIVDYQRCKYIVNTRR